jgi:hypothetical protein
MTENITHSSQNSNATFPGERCDSLKEKSAHSARAKPSTAFATAGLLLLIAIAIAAQPATAQGVAQTHVVEVCNDHNGRGGHEINSTPIAISKPSIQVRAYRKFSGSGAGANGTTTVRPRLSIMDDTPANSYVLLASSTWSGRTVSPANYMLSVDESYMGLTSDAYRSCVLVAFD